MLFSKLYHPASCQLCCLGSIYIYGRLVEWFKFEACTTPLLWGLGSWVGRVM